LTASAGAFKRVQADIDTVQFTQEGTFSTSGGYTQNLIMNSANPQPNSMHLLMSWSLGSLAVSRLSG
jgi:hypothetical protein